MYIGHKSDDGHVQSLKEHLEGVAKLAEEFAVPFYGQAHAKRTGLLHDAGKYSEAGQKRMNDPQHTAKVDHSTAGARIALEQLKDAYGAVAIAGHHGGMPDKGNKFSGEDDGTLFARVRKDLSGRLDAGAFWQENEIEKDGGKVFPEWLLKERLPFSVQFYTRMLFSCLVDADYSVSASDENDAYLEETTNSRFDADDFSGNHASSAASGSGSSEAGV